MKFAHLADTHIRNLKYHKEYKAVFSQLYEKLKEEKVDYIVHCGDIAHTKTQISPEFVEMCTDFFRNLADIAPTYIILGNHDGNLKNSSRQDALTPIVDALEHPNLSLLKNSGETTLEGNFALNVLSVFDRDNWQTPSDDKRINIALYHGSISNCKTDLNWTMEHGEDELGIFTEFDYAMLGDIHKQQSLDESGRVRYCGSTVQQNHGETNDKGFLLWEIESKDDFTVRHVELKNPKPFLTIQLTPKGKIPRNTRVDSGARLRLVANNNLPLDAIRRAAEIAKKRFDPESVTFLSRAAGQRGNVDEITNSIFKEDLRDPAVQKELIEEYLKDFQADGEVLERVYDLNNKFNTIIEKDEEVARNINWKLLSLEWDNLFNYGDGNKIEFGTEDTTGTVGVLGKNYSGKSSIIDSFLYTLFNSTSKNTRKNLNIINQNKQSCRGKVEILVDGKVYSVERESEKYVKKLKGEETLEAKTDVDFKYINELGETVSKNGLSRIDTDKNIRKVFGTIDDFFLTSMASQHGALAFIAEGSTRRKEILAKFLDLELFEKKFRIAKEEGSDIKGALRRIEGTDFDTDLLEAQKEVATNETLTSDKKSECATHQLDLEIVRGEIDLLNEKLKSMPSEIIDFGEVQQELTEKTEMKDSLCESSDKIRTACEEKRELYKKILSFVETFDIEAYRSKKQEVLNLNSNLEKVEAEIRDEQGQKDHHQTKIGLLSEVPCGEEFSHCKFIKDAYSSKLALPAVLKTIKTQQNSFIRLQNEIGMYNTPKIDEHIDKYEEVLRKRNETANEIAQCELQVEKNQNQIILLDNDLLLLEQKKQNYETNKDVIENYTELKKERTALTRKVKRIGNKIATCEELLQQLYVSHGGFIERVENIKKQKVELQILREEYEAYDLFMRAMHANGISYDIIKKRLPIINEEVAKVLANVVDFEVFFEESGNNRLDIYIKHPKHDPRPLEIGSGAEKSIAAMAIRLALLNVSTLPKPNLFILDEPGTSLDEENMEGFVRILDLVKTHFDTVILISHLDSLKDCVDTQLLIDKKGDFAYVNH